MPRFLAQVGRCRRVGALGVILSGTLMVGVLQAQEQPFTVTPRVSTGATITDNVNTNDERRDTDLILRFAPGISATADGNRVTGRAQYQVRTLYQVDGSNRTGSTQLFNVDGNAEVLEDFLFLDASAQRREQAFALVDSAALAGGVGQSQATEVRTWRVSPYLRERLGRFADLTVRYAQDRTSSGAGVRRDQRTDTYSAQLDSGTLFGRFFWNAEAEHRKTDFDESTQDDRLDDEVTFESYSGTLGYELTRQFRVFGTVGSENNDFTTQRSDRDGDFWSAGFTWSPSRNTSLEASAGERFFGETADVTLRHRRQRTVWEASYSQQVSTNLQRRRIQPSDEEFEDVLGELFFGDGSLTAEDFLLTEEQVSVFEQVQSSFALEMPRGRWRLQGFFSEREFQQVVLPSTEDQKQMGVQTSLLWELGPRTTWNTSLRYSEIDFSDGDNQKLYSGRTGLSSELGENVNASLTYRHQQRDSQGTTGRSFRENAITATLDMTF